MPDLAVYLDLDYLRLVSAEFGRTMFDTAMQVLHLVETLGRVTRARAYTFKISEHDVNTLRHRQIDVVLGDPATAILDEVTVLTRRNREDLPIFIFASDDRVRPVLEFLGNVGARTVVISDAYSSDQEWNATLTTLSLGEVLSGSEALVVHLKQVVRAQSEKSGSRERSGSNASAKQRNTRSVIRKVAREFLCHASADKPSVRRLYAKLSSDGFHPWLDEEDLLPGEDWEQKISAAVRDSAVVLVCLSQHSTTKEGFVQKEIKYALDVADEKPGGTIFIIPVRLENCEVPPRLRRWHWVNLFEENGYNRLCQALRSRYQSSESA